jgi:tRNA(Ile)-lysidine synthase
VLEQFLNHIRHNQLCKTSDKILLAVSGGMDSMVMLHLFKEAAFSFGVAHCNFQLRGTESDEDEALVRSVCERLKIPFYARHFDTRAVAAEKKQSLQMAARELRYHFFAEIQQVHGYQYLATAHHLNDNFETVLLNLTRGSGIEGLTGIPVKNDSVIRPLLFAQKKMINDYAVAHGVVWRDDSSNSSEDYQRNFLRLQIIPRLKELNPNLENTFEDTLERLSGASELVKDSLDKIRQQAVSVHANKLYITKGKLAKYRHAEVILWELLKGYGFNFDQCKLMMSNLPSGRQFFSGSHQLIIDRDNFILQQKQSPVQQELVIEEGENQVASELGILNLKMTGISSFTLVKNIRLAQLDASRLRYPLCWRSWRAGDSFVPFGMTQRKKVSDFLIDLKVSLPAKEKVTVLESAGEIVWVVGYRIDDRYKITPDTREVLIVETRPV